MKIKANNSIKKERRKELKEAEVKLKDLILAHELLEKAIEKYNEDIRESEAKLAYSKGKVQELNKKLERTKSSIEKWSRKRKICK